MNDAHRHGTEEAPAPAPVPRTTRRRSIRRVLLVTVAGALAPLAAIAAAHGVLQLRAERETFRAGLAASTQRDAAADSAMIRAAEGVVALLAANPEIASGNPARCNPVLADAARNLPRFTRFAVRDSAGATVCASGPEAAGRPGEPLIGVAHPAGTGPDRRLVTAAVRLAAFEAPPGNATIVALLDASGTVVAATAPLAFARFDPARPEGTVADRSGRAFAYAHAPLATGTGPGTDPGAGSGFRLAHVAPLPGLAQAAPAIVPLFLLPFLALLLAALAVWFGANAAILRWVRRLGESARAIADGNDRPAPEAFAAAPVEVRGLAADLARTARAIAERDQRLSENVARQRALTRELHHRVRNNLQVVGSYLALRGSDPEGGARALAAARLRVSALALVHRLLYDSGELTTVSTDALLGELCELVNSHATTRRRLSFDCEIESLPLAIDAAVPLAMWTIELVSLLADRADASPGKTRLTLRLAAGDGAMRLEIGADTGAPPGPDEATGRRLLAETARQLGGHTEADSLDSPHPSIALVLPLARLAQK